MPPPASAVSADGGARNVNSLSAGVPPSVIAVSRLATVEVGGAEHRRDRCEHARRIRGQLVAQHTLEVDVAREREGHRLPAATPADRGRRRRRRQRRRSSSTTSAVGRRRGPRPRRHRHRQRVRPTAARPPIAAPATTSTAKIETRIRRRIRRKGTEGPVAFPAGAVRTLTPMRVPELTPRAFRRLTLGNLVLLAIIIVTGAAVRLTDSGSAATTGRTATPTTSSPSARSTKRSSSSTGSSPA